MFYIVVSEEWYGGDMGVFDNIVDAQVHQMLLSDKGKNDTKIYKINKLPFKISDYINK